MANSEPVYPEFSGEYSRFADDADYIVRMMDIGPNFAEHYSIITFGCGTGCKYGYIVDHETGKMVDFPLGGEEHSYMTWDFNSHSNTLLTTYSHLPIEFIDGVWTSRYSLSNSPCIFAEFAWNGSEFEKVREVEVARPIDDELCPIHREILRELGVESLENQIFVDESAIPHPPFCDIPDQKVWIIEQFLCGEFSDENSYQKSGSNCATESLLSRQTDTLIQANIFRMCGYSTLAFDIELAAYKTGKMLEQLSVCIGEKVDWSGISSRAVTLAANASSTFQCTEDFKNRIQSKAQDLRGELAATQNMPDDYFLETLNLFVDESGTIRSH